MIAPFFQVSAPNLPGRTATLNPQSHSSTPTSEDGFLSSFILFTYGFPLRSRRVKHDDLSFHLAHALNRQLISGVNALDKGAVSFF